MPAIPAAVYNVAAALLAHEAGVPVGPPWSRVHLGRGRWITLRAARSRAPGDEAGVVVTLEPTTVDERREVFALAHGLSPREREVLDALAAGADTAAVAASLFLSEHTVHDHVKAVLAKTEHDEPPGPLRPGNRRQATSRVYAGSGSGHDHEFDRDMRSGGCSRSEVSSRGARVRRSRSRPINVPDPGPGEAVVKIQACGVCHTDLHYREGGINDDFPFLLGHEAAGVVEAVGEGVTNVAPGDFVILNWRAVCGDCRACHRGEPWYCFATHNAAQKMTLEDGTELSPALGIGAFIEKTLVHSGQCTKVDPTADPAAVGLLGCGVMAGIGAAINTGAVTRGKSVAVIGCGGVGCAASRAPPSPAPGTIIAVDLDDRKLEWAEGSAPRTRSTARSTDPVEAIQELTGGFGADVVVEAVGRPETWKQAFYARDLAGTVVLVGVPTPGHEDPRHPADRRLRSRRCPQVELVRRLPARPGTSRCSSTSTSRAVSTSTRSCPSGSGSTTWRPPSRRCTTATCCARW